MDVSAYQSETAAQKAREIAAHRAQKPPRKKLPQKLAVIDQIGCTGCEACIIFCPVDCIEIVPGVEHAQFQQIVEVDLARCIGCALCAKHCPWDTIPMLSFEEGLREAPSLTLKTVCGQKTVNDVPSSS